jgi:hypothetical protein
MGAPPLPDRSALREDHDGDSTYFACVPVVPA